MSAWWDILEVDKDADERTIKRAYAKKLKTIDQETDPAGFMALRSALEQSRMFASNRVEVESQDRKQASDGFDEVGHTALASLESLARDREQVDLLEGLKAQATRLATSSDGRQDINGWRKICNDPRLDDLSEFDSFEQYLREKLLFVTGFHGGKRGAKFSKDVGQLLFSTFHWKRDVLVTAHSTDEIDWLSRRLQFSFPDETLRKKMIKGFSNLLVEKNLWYIGLPLFFVVLFTWWFRFSKSDYAVSRYFVCALLFINYFRLIRNTVVIVSKAFSYDFLMSKTNKTIFFFFNAFTVSLILWFFYLPYVGSR